MNKASKYCLPLLMAAQTAYAAEPAENVDLADIVVTAKRPLKHTSPFQAGIKPSDLTINGAALKNRSANLGDALAKEPGLHSNPFGGGASAPIIRGQEGVRIKVLQNGSDIVDMSHLSPDHATAADTLLAERVEVVRGVATLLYGSASAAGVVNVIDKRVPSEIPEKGYEGEAAVRFNNSGKEKVATTGLTVGLGQHIALRAEGLTRHAGNYSVPNLNIDENTAIGYLPDTHNKSRVGTVGLSWVGSKGCLGIAHSHRRDRYGLPAHNHYHDITKPHIIQDSKPYLFYYPHLHTEKDLAPHYHGGPESSAKPADELHELGYRYDHTKPGPWVDLTTRRSDLQGEWRQPFAGVDKIRLALAYTRYYHDEKDAGKDQNWNQHSGVAADENFGRANNIFNNRGLGARLEIHHHPSNKLRGVWGVHYQQSKSDAYHSKIINRSLRENWMLIPNTQKQLGFFGAGQWRAGDWTLEAGARTEKQRIPIRYDADKLIVKKGGCNFLCRLRGGTSEPDVRLPEPEAYNRRANSYGLSAAWSFHPDYSLNVAYSQNERNPSPMELYYTGEHLATNSFEYGNKDLRKERSRNLEIGLRYHTEPLDYSISLYRNHFDNYIYKQTIFQEGTLATHRYAQSKARFHGIEGRLNFRPHHKHQITLWGDYIRGRLVDMPDHVSYDTLGFVESIRSKPDRNAPRVPPARVGITLFSQWNKHLDSTIDYTRVFGQHKTSYFESFSREFPEDIKERATPGHHLLNMGVGYSGNSGSFKYRLYADVNNVLNQKIYNHTSFLAYVPQMGRNVSVGIHASF